VAKEFLGASGVLFASWDIGEPDGRAAWEAAGKPAVPSLMVGTETIRLLTPRFQIATILGLPLPAHVDAVRLAWDITTIQEEWLALVRSVDWTALTMPTPSRGRTPADLVVNVFTFYEAAEESWSQRPGVWSAAALQAADAAVHEQVRDHASAVAYVEERLAAWRLFVEGLDGADPEGITMVQHPEGGTIVFRELLDMQRQHGAQHLRQVLYTYERAGIAHAGCDPRELVAGLELPEHPF